MSKRILLLFFLFLGTNFLFAQSPLVTTEGPVLPIYNSQMMHFSILNHAEEQFVAYIGPQMFTKKQPHGIITYDKTTHLLKKQIITLPCEYAYLFAMDAGESYFATYARYLKKNTFSFATASIAKSDTTSISVVPKERFSFSIETRGYVKSFTAVSNSKQYFATVFTTFDKKSTMRGFHIFVYSKNGEEKSYQYVSAEQLGTKVSLQDVQVNDQGEVLLLFVRHILNTEEAKNGGIVCMVCSSSRSENYMYPVDFGSVHTARLLQLRNGNYCIGGYYGTNDDSETIGCFFYIIDLQRKTIVEGHHYPFTKDYVSSVGVPFMTAAKNYQTHCKSMYELENGSVAMLGEQSAMMWVEDQGKYYYALGDILCQYFDTHGECIASHIVHKKQKMLVPYLLTEMPENNFTPNDMGLSFGAFCKENQVYVLYTDKLPNAVGEEATNLCLVNKTCTMLSVFSKDGVSQKKVAILPGVAKRLFHTVWLSEDKDIFFGMFHSKIVGSMPISKSYSIEHLMIE